MSLSTWRPEDDAVLIPAYTSGIPAGVIAEQIGKTRFSVIGRANRLGLSHPSRISRPKNFTPRPPRVRAPKTSGPSSSIGRPRLLWPDDLAAKYQAWTAERVPLHRMASLLGVSHQTLVAKLARDGLRAARTVKRFTAEEDAIICRRFADHDRVQDIAANLGRDFAVLRQHILHLGLHRNAALTVLKRNYGDWVMNIGDPAKIEEVLAAENATAKAAALNAHQSLTSARLRDLDSWIANGMPRNQAIRKTRATGVILETIGSHHGVTRERIRQICL